MDAKLKGNTHMEKRIERAVEANQRVGWMGKSMGLPTVNFAVEVSWKGTKAQQKKLDAVQNKWAGRYWKQVEQWHHAQ